MHSTTDTEAIDVVIALLYDALTDRFFVTERLPSAHLAGYYEFPGGKVEAHETAPAALTRELQEEIGVTPHEMRHYECVTHRYPDRRLRLSFYLVTSWQGDPAPQEGQRGFWCDRQALNPDRFPQANRALIQQLIQTAL